MIFQLTTSRRGRPGGGCSTLNNLRNFNSRPHEEVDRQQEHAGSGKPISTHDLTKRSTLQSMTDDCEYKISTHDLTKRSTFISYQFTVIHKFQLTTSRRGRRNQIAADFPRLHFNSRPHEEVDWLAFIPPTWYNNFNSRPHEEVDKSW